MFDKQHKEFWAVVYDPAPLYDKGDVPRSTTLDVVLQNCCRYQANTFSRFQRRLLEGGSLTFDRQLHRHLDATNDQCEKGFGDLAQVDQRGGKHMRPHNKAHAAQFKFMKTGLSKLITKDDIRAAAKLGREEMRSMPSAKKESAARGEVLKQEAVLKKEKAKVREEKKKQKQNEGSEGKVPRKAPKGRMRHSEYDSDDGESEQDDSEEEEVEMCMGDAMEELASSLVDLGAGKYKWGNEVINTTDTAATRGERAAKRRAM